MVFLGVFLPSRPMKMKFYEIFFLPIFVPLLKSKKTSLKKLIYLSFEGQEIHLSDFSEKHPKNADLFFLSENGGGSRVFFFKHFF